MAPLKLRYEVCVESADGVRAALAAGADRVELCADLAVGGTTPSIGLIEWTVRSAHLGGIAAHVLIRPRGGDFVYSADEEDVMARDIRAAREAGADGVVIGALTPSGAVDVPLAARLIAVARPLSVTFHRAFDSAADPAAAFADILELGADRLLTSGGAPTALEGADVIRSLTARSEGRIIVMAGSGVTESTAAQIVRRTSVRELHFSARASAPDLPLSTRISRIMTAARRRPGRHPRRARGRPQADPDGRPQPDLGHADYPARPRRAPATAGPGHLDLGQPLTSAPRCTPLSAPAPAS